MDMDSARMAGAADAPAEQKEALRTQLAADAKPPQTAAPATAPNTEIAALRAELAALRRSIAAGGSVRPQMMGEDPFGGAEDEMHVPSIVEPDEPHVENLVFGGASAAAYDEIFKISFYDDNGTSMLKIANCKAMVGYGIIVECADYTAEISSTSMYVAATITIGSASTTSSPTFTLTVCAYDNGYLPPTTKDSYVLPLYKIANGKVGLDWRHLPTIPLYI